MRMPGRALIRWGKWLWTVWSPLPPLVPWIGAGGLSLAEQFFTEARCPACHKIPDTWLIGEERWNASQFIECALCHAEFDALLTSPQLGQLYRMIGGVAHRV